MNLKTKYILLILMLLCAARFLPPDQWRAGSPPEPEVCALCGNGSAIRYHAPCLLDLSTGEIKALNLYPTAAAQVIGPPVQRNIFTFGSMGPSTEGLDPETQTLTITSPIVTDDMDPRYFCCFCRELLYPVADQGLVIVDLFDLSAIQAYPVKHASACTIRDYNVTVSIDREQYEKYVIQVVGHVY